MTQRQWLILAIALLTVGAVAAEETTTQPTTQSTTRPAPPELCRDAIDPFHPAGERLRFLRAAGKDSELTEQEFTMSAAAGNTFVRKFDRWKVLLAYDVDGNGTINWFEAKPYRQHFRALVLAKFDADKDSKLKGEERRKVNQALADGKLVPIRPKVQPVHMATPELPDPAAPAGLPGGAGRPPRAGAGGPGGRPAPGQGGREQIMARYDSDGDGKLSDTERQAMIEEFQRQRSQRDESRYDADADGKLSEDERTAMEDARRKRREDRWTRRFDRDGDGVLSDSEQTEADVTTTQMQSFREIGERYVLDLDGDGTVSDAERVRGMVEIGKQFGQMRREMESMVDTDGDGQVTREERRAFGERMRVNWNKRVNGYTREFDLNGDAKLDDEEREKMKTGIREDTARQFADFDTDGDGRLDAEERAKMMREWVREMTGAGP